MTITTITTITTDSASSNCTSRTDARMVVVRSVTTRTSSAAGSDCCKFGSSFLMPSTTWMTFAPGWRCTFRMIAGVASTHAPSLVFSGPCTMVATSVSMAGRPLR